MSGRRRSGPPVVLAFGGFDPTGGAGILMDARAIVAAGGYPVAAPSCLAIQSTAAFDRVVPLSRDTIRRALDCIARSHRIAAVKVGMVGTRNAAAAILEFLDPRPDLPVVLDPVIRATSGGSLLAKDALPSYRTLLERADVLTPNLPEAEMLLDRRIGRFEDAVIAARDLAAGAGVVLKGGHFPWKGKRGIDLVYDEGTVTLLAPGRKPTARDAHGTGCAFASALAARIAAGDPLAGAAGAAKDLVARWIEGGFPSAEGRWTLDEKGGGEAR
ncbi:MAG TPA: hydroxymethylpyrimidine/phosphomethylpyrimidine kinase [Candidatus Deferrimicrobiaceae bacterium]